MLQNVKKAADVFKSPSSGSHAELKMAIYREKCVQDAFTKLMYARREASSAWLLYANSEKSESAKQLFLQMNAIDNYRSTSYQQYYDQYEFYREHFQQILKGERAVDDFQKTADDYTPKIQKLQKQIDALGSKGRDRKYEALSTDMGKYLSLQQDALRQYENRKENHSLFKYKNIKDAVRRVTEAQIKMHEQCFEIFQTQRMLLDYYTATTYSTITQAGLAQAKSSSQALIGELEKKLGMGVSADTAQCGVEDQPDDDIHTTHQQLMARCESVDNSEDIALYNPIPEQVSPAVRGGARTGGVNHTTRGERPLPPLPPTAPDSDESHPVYMDARPEPPEPEQQMYANAEPPPVPPRSDGGGAQRRSTGGRSQPADLHTNSVYSSSDTSPSYIALATAYSGQPGTGQPGSRNSSVKSNTSRNSRSDSGMGSNRGSVQSNASQQEEEVYEVLDGQKATQKRFSQIASDNLYEI